MNPEMALPIEEVIKLFLTNATLKFVSITTHFPMRSHSPDNFWLVWQGKPQNAESRPYLVKKRHASCELFQRV